MSNHDVVVSSSFMRFMIVYCSVGLLIVDLLFFYFMIIAIHSEANI